MKRLITAVILPFICLAAAVSSAVCTDRALTNAIDKIGEMESSEQFDEEGAQKLFGEWERDKKFLAVLLKHEDVDEIEMHLNKIAYTARTKSEDYNEALDEARRFIIGVRDGERLSPQSVF